VFEEKHCCKTTTTTIVQTLFSTSAFKIHNRNENNDSKNNRSYPESRSQLALPKSTTSINVSRRTTCYHQHEQHELPIDSSYSAGSWARKRPPGAFASHALVLTSLLKPPAAAAVHFVLPRYYIPASFRFSLPYFSWGRKQQLGSGTIDQKKNQISLKELPTQAPFLSFSRAYRGS
jgi:hypothetical protein